MTQRPTEPEAAAPRLLELVRGLLAELHPHGRPHPVTLDSSLERDLGLDSLGRTELLHQVEDAFGVRLPEQLLVTAETPRDVLRALLAHPGRTPTEELQVAFLRAEPATELPQQARTLTEALEWHASSHPDRVHVHLQAEGGVVELSYEGLLTGATEVAAGLQARGLQPGQTVAIMLPTSLEYLEAFFGALLSGLIPVPIYPPFRPSQLEEHLRRQAGILRNAQASVLVSVPEVRSLAHLLRATVESLQAIETVAALKTGSGLARLKVGPQDVAFLQYTSGSTGSPKGVVLTHANLLANIRAMGQVAEVGPEDVFVSWLPLYHDMGLIGAWLGSLYYGIPLVLLSPLQFLARPERWLWAIHRYGGTLSAAPNFAYEICARRLKPEDLEGLELSTWRMAVNGAEPVSAETLDHFAERFRPYGFKREALAPVYGLAESSVGLAFPPPGRGPVIDRVHREALLGEGHAVPALPEDAEAVRMVACGQPLPGHQVRIVDAWGREVPERAVGRLEFKGPSCTSGYYRNPEATRGLFRDGWLDSGDLAYVARGDVYISGRVKDVIIRGGRHVFPYELEEAVGDVPGIRKGCVAVIGTTGPVIGTERLVVIAETREESPAERRRLVERINALGLELLGEPPDEVVLAPPHAVLKTSSGKIRRSATRELYERGELASGRAVWLQVLRLWLSGLGPGLRRSLRTAAEHAYSGYAWLVFLLIGPVGWVLTVSLPDRSWRRGVVRTLSRGMVRLLGLRVHVHGAEHLAGGAPCVLVANHASYFDALVLAVTMPLSVTYVAKREFTRWTFTRLFFERLGTMFVERVEVRQAVEDARRLAGVLRRGESLFVFPEGGFVREPGLRPFHLGAFLVAAEEGVPVVPVAIRGTRSLLRAHSRFVRRGVVDLTIEGPIAPDGRDVAAAAKLRDAAFEAVLRHAGELAREQGATG